MTDQTIKAFYQRQDILGETYEPMQQLRFTELATGVRRVTVSLASPIDSLMVLKVVASILFVKVLPLYMTPACCG